MYKLGIDVGVTNTDSVLIDENRRVVAEVKHPTSGDIYDGIVGAVRDVLARADVDRTEIRQAMLGTTQCTNAIVERKNLAPIGILRIGAPATLGIPPMVDWDEDIRRIAVDYAIVGGGFEYDGKELAAFDQDAARRFFEGLKGKVQSVAISCVFSTVRNDHELAAAALCREAEEGVTNADVYLSQNDGTLMTMEYARRYPILTIACGPTNSIRGASYLSKLNDAVVIDVGGTTTDLGMIQNGFPRESGVAVTIGGVRTNFRMPDVISIGLGGGSIVRCHEDGSVTVGPDSVGYRIAEKALVFGGDTMTATDVAVRLGMAELGDPSLAAGISEETAGKAMDAIRSMIEDSIDAMKVSGADIDVVLVGGGSIIVPGQLAGTRNVVKPDHFGTANAIGSAISKVSGTLEQLINYDEIPREEALRKARAEAIELAVKSGAVRETVEIIDVEDVPLAYYPGNTNRVKIKAAGDLADA